MAKVKRIDNANIEIPCCAYARVSTMKEEQESSLLMQESYWTEKLQSLPNRKFCGVFADQGISGSRIIQRKEYCKMIDLAMAGFIKEIYTKSIYRFGRNSKETMEVIQKLREKGVAIIFDEENINTLKCPQDLLLKIKAILGEQELKTMSMNVQFTTRNKFKQGIVPKTLTFGYDHDENQHMIINEAEAKIVRFIFSMYLKGYGTNSIANQLTKLKIATCCGHEVWHPCAIKGMLTNEKYVGDALLQKETYTNGIRKKNTGELEQYYVTNDHDAIIDRDTFNRVQELMQKKFEYSKQVRPNMAKTTYALSGKIQCGLCGKNFRHRINKKIINFDNRLWMCLTKERRGKAICPAIEIPEPLLNEIILDAYNDYIDTPYELPCDTELKNKIREQQELQERLKRLYLDKLITYAQYKKEIESIQEKLSDMLDKMRNYKILSIYKKPKTKAREYSDEIVNKHIEKVIITGYKVQIVFKNLQSITKEYIYEHRKYRKNY